MIRITCPPRLEVKRTVNMETSTMTHADPKDATTEIPATEVTKTGEHRTLHKDTLHTRVLRQLATCRSTPRSGTTQEADDPTPDPRLFNPFVRTSEAHEYSEEAVQRQEDQQTQDRQHIREARRWYMSGKPPRTGQPHLQRNEPELVRELLRLAA